MPPAEPAPRTPSRRLLRLLPWAISIALHAALVAGGIFVAWGSPAEPKPLVVVVDAAPGEQPRTAPAPRAEVPATPAAEIQPRELPAPALVAPRRPRPAVAPAVLRDASPPADAAALAESMLARSTPAVRFGGVGMPARRVVFVVDASGSMASALGMVKTMLERALAELDAEQRFQVVFFQDDQPLLAPRTGDDPRERRLLAPTADDLASTRAWIASIRPRGTSDPLPALELALALRPDAIFLLSKSIDGAGAPDPERVLARLEELNPLDPRTGRRAVTIKTLRLPGAGPEGLLARIGAAHGGRRGTTSLSREDVTQP